MRGHIHKRGSGYVPVVDLPKQPAQRCIDCRHRIWVAWGRAETSCPKCGGELGPAVGERRQRWLASHRTKKAAEAELRRFLSQVEAGGDPFPTALTVADWAQRWITSDRVTSLRTQTSSRYRQVVRDDLVPVLGSMQLADVRPRHIGLVLEHVARRGVSPRTVAHARAVASSCMRAALEAELIDANPVTAVRPPRSKRPTLKVPTAAQLAALIAESKATTYEIPLLLSATTGMRRSEVLALSWANVDLTAGRIRVVASLQRIRDDQGSRLGILDGKTDRARREVALPTIAIERLRRWRSEQTERRLRLGPAWRDHDLVCDRGDGAPLDPDAYSNGFKRLAARAGLPAGTRLHDVRHGVATALLERGVHPAITSAVLGHSSPAFTMGTYQHVLDGMTDKAAAELEAALGG